MFELPFLFLIFFFCNMLKIPFLGIGVIYITPFLICFNIKDIKKIFFILFYLAIFVSIQLVFDQTGFFEIISLKQFLILLTGSIFGTYLYRQNNNITIKSLIKLCFFMIILFLITYIFRTEQIFQYTRIDGYGVITGKLPIYLKTDKISFSGLASDPNQIASGIFLIYTLFKDKFKLNELLIIFFTALILDAKFVCLSIIIISFLIFFKIESNKIKRSLTFSAILGGVYVLSKGFSNSRYKIWYGYLTRFTKDGISFFGYNLEQINIFQLFFKSAHNTFLDIYLYTGVIGLLIFIFLIYRYVLNKEDPLIRFLAICLSIFGISFFKQPIFYLLLTILINSFSDINFPRTNKKLLIY